MGYSWDISSGKRYKKLWNITMLLMGKSTISMVMFNSKLLVYQRVTVLTMLKNIKVRQGEG